MTNAECIKGMSVAELAWYLSEIETENYDGTDTIDMFGSVIEMGVVPVINWLNEESRIPKVGI